MIFQANRKGTVKGSAISDFLASMLFFAPFFVAFTLIGKLSDVEHSAQQKARYAAWERTVSTEDNKSNKTIENESLHRITNQQTWIATAQDKKNPEDDFDPDRMLWGMDIPGGLGSRQSLVSFDQEGSALSTLSAGGVGKVNKSLSYITEGMADLDREGLYKGEAEYAINEVASLKLKGNTNCGTGELDGYLTCIKRHNTILTDDWSSSSPGQVEERVRERMPYSLKVWEPIADALDKLEEGVGKPLGYLAGYNPFADIKHIDESPGYVLPDIVPPSRLGNYDDENFSESLDK